MKPFSVYVMFVIIMWCLYRDMCAIIETLNSAKKPVSRRPLDR